MVFGLTGWGRSKYHHYDYHLLPSPAPGSPTSTRELHTALLPSSSDTFYYQPIPAPPPSKFQRLVGSSRSFLHFAQTRQKRHVLFALGAFVLSIIFAVAIGVTYFNAEAVHARLLAHVQPLGDVCPVSSSEVLRRVPSDDLLRWQRPWRDDLLCRLSRGSVRSGIVSVNSTSYYSFSLPPSDRLQIEGGASDSPTPHPVQPVTSIPAYCLEAYFAGLPCSCATPSPASRPPSLSRSGTQSAKSMGSDEVVERFAAPPLLDVLWTWVNGSDPLHAQELQASRRRLRRPDESGKKLFRFVRFRAQTFSDSGSLLTPHLQEP